MQSYFADGADRDFVFSKAEMENKIDLHAIRAEVAKRTYAYYMRRLETEPGYRDKLTSEIRARWEKRRSAEKREKET